MILLNVEKFDYFGTIYSNTYDNMIKRQPRIIKYEIKGNF